MKKIFLSFALFFCACGYAPLNVATSKMLGESVNVITIINKAEPKDSITLNDNFTNYVEHYMHKSVSKTADSKIILRILSSEFIPLYYDEFGYAKSYKAIIRLEFNVTFQDETTKKIITSGEHIFNTNTISVLSDEQKSRAINLASQKAFNEFALRIIM